MHLLGLPHPGSPLGSCFPLSFPWSSLKTSPHPLEEGRGTWWAGDSWFEGWWRGEVMVVVVDERRMYPRSTVMQLISDSNSAATLNRLRQSQHLRVRLEK